MLSGLNFHTGTVVLIKDQNRAFVLSDDHKLRALTLKTTFVGAVEDKVAMASLRPGLTVNMWGNSTQAKFASINYK